MHTETIDLNGHPFFVRHWGNPENPPLLMLHGFPEYGGAWAELAPLLTDQFYCIAPDQRGYGQSWAPTEVENYTGAALTSDMAALIAHYGDKVTVLGHDWGAAVAYGLAMFYPQLVDRLIILNGVHPVPFQRALATGGAQTEASQYITYLRQPDSHEKLAANNLEKMITFFSARMAFNWLSPERLEEYRTEWARPGRLNGMINWYRASPLLVPKPGEPLQELPSWPKEKMMVRCPHLLIWGLGDKALLPEVTDGLEEFAPDLTRIEMEDVDHWLCHQKPHEVAAHILNWTAT
ncbi:MAG: alpha/beta fold hydrolase [Paracoccaceae bacterium]